MLDQNRVCQGSEEPWVLINPYYSDDPTLYARLQDHTVVRLPPERVKKLPGLLQVVTQQASSYG